MAKRVSPSLVIAFSNLIVFAVLNGFQLVTQIPISYINKWIMPGVDYRDFYQGSLQIFNGGSPYLVERYVTPPLFAVVNIPLALQGFGTARALFLFLIPFSVLASCLLIFRMFSDVSEQEKNQFILGCILVILFSYPVYFLFERGNIDGVVLLLMCLAVFTLTKFPWLSGLFLAAAVHFKLYPVLLLLPLAAFRRWKALLWTMVWTLTLALLTAPYWSDFAVLLSKRSNSFQLFENGSLVNTLLFFSVMVSKTLGIQYPIWEYAPLQAAVLFGLFISILMLADSRLYRSLPPGQQITNALLYFPFMVALPKSVYHYEFVVLIALLPALDELWKRSSSRSEIIALWIVAFGLALSQWQAVALHTLTGNMAAYYIPGLGLLIIMTGIVALKFVQLKHIPRSKINL